MDLMHLVDRLEELVASAQKMPIGNRAIIDRRRLLDIIDQMRIAIPEEVRVAQEMVLHREEIRREAEEEARIVVARAEEQSARLVESHEITEAARRRAQEVASQAEVRLEERIRQANDDIQGRIDQSRQLARQQMDAADEYARELLSRLRAQLEAFVRSVDSGIRQLEPEAETELPPPYEAEPDAAEDESGSTSEYDDARDPPEPTAAPSARPAPAPLREREPVPLRRARAEERKREREPDDELENLLRRNPAPRVPAAASHSVIDDFEHPPLDDDPTIVEPEDTPPPRR